MDAVVSLLGLSPRYVGGSETYARELSQQLGEHGWRSIICFLDEPPQLVRSYLDLPNVSIEVIRNAVEPNPQALRDLARILWRYRPRIFHMQLVGFLGFYPWLARLLSAKKIFFTDQGSHPSDYVPHRAPMWKRIAVRMINFPLSKVICVSNYNHLCFTTRDVLPAKRFEVIYNSADFSRVEQNQERRDRFRAKYGISQDRAVIVQVSWIIPEKGITDLLEALSLVLKTNQNVHLVLVGEGSYRNEYMAFARDLGLDAHVTWTGLVADPFSEGVYDAADVVCQVSRWQEAFGQTIAEAMACRKPVIGTRVGGIPELIQDGESGYLVNPRDIEAIAGKILLLVNSRELRYRMGETCYTVAKARFDLKKNVRRVLELYGIASG
jgi:glycosyltransferase involved in cell wall biosynthesis